MCPLIPVVRQSHTAGQARRRTKFCPFASVSPKRHTTTRCTPHTRTPSKRREDGVGIECGECFRVSFGWLWALYETTPPT